jgi:hypothetical protein
VPGSGRAFREAELQAWGARFDAPQNLERGSHHLGADSVTRQYGNMESCVGGHRFFRMALCRSRR